jgi:DnaJ-domain-containing protein 1
MKKTEERAILLLRAFLERPPTRRLTETEIDVIRTELNSLSDWHAKILLFVHQHHHSFSLIARELEITEVTAPGLYESAVRMFTTRLMRRGLIGCRGRPKSKMHLEARSCEDDAVRYSMRCPSCRNRAKIDPQSDKTYRCSCGCCFVLKRGIDGQFDAELLRNVTRAGVCRDFSKEDDYSVLGVTRFASREELKQARNARSREYHPDKLPHGTGREIIEFATEITKLINLAYERLMRTSG